MTTANEFRNRSPRPRAWQRLRSALAGVLGLSMVGAAIPPAVAQATVPQHWISYAQWAGNQFEAWLADGGNDAVVRLHAHLQARLLGASDAPPVPLIVRVWVAPNGQVERLAFDTLGTPSADADLRTTLMAQPLSEPPPRDMRQPMVLQLRLDFAS